MHWWLQEVDRLAPLGAPDAPFGALADFTYLEAVVSEALRLYPPVPMLMREAAQDWDLAGEPGWRIPAHSFVVVPVFAIGRDPAVWGPDVAEFRPERWLGHGKGGVNKHAVLGFGAGGRACIGKRFALDFTAMRASGLTRLSIPRLRAARRTLQAVGLLELVGKHRAGSVHQTFALIRLRPNMTDAPNITRLPSSKACNPKGKKGGGAKITYDA